MKPFYIKHLSITLLLILSNTLPQVGANVSYASSLLQIYLTVEPPSDVVNKLASWLCDLTHIVWITTSILSQTKW